MRLRLVPRLPVLSSSVTEYTALHLHLCYTLGSVCFSVSDYSCARFAQSWPLWYCGREKYCFGFEVVHFRHSSSPWRAYSRAQAKLHLSDIINLHHELLFNVNVSKLYIVTSNTVHVILISLSRLTWSTTCTPITMGVCTCTWPHYYCYQVAMIPCAWSHYSLLKEYVPIFPCPMCVYMYLIPLLLLLCPHVPI